MSLKEKLKYRRNVHLIQSSPLFNKSWYMSQHTDIDFKKISPAAHYLTEGWKHSFDPSESFSNTEYLEMYSDVADSGMCPLLHYELCGRNEGRIYSAKQALEESIYKSHAVRRFFSRHYGRIRYAGTIRKNKDKKILLVLHLFYMHSWKELKQYLKNLAPYDYDLCITYPESLKDQDVLDAIAKFKPGTKFISCGNQGFDVGPYLEALNAYDLSKYDYVFKLHSKGTSRNKMFMYDQIFKKRDWFLYLYESILGSSNVHKVMKVLAENEKVGLVAAENLIVPDPKHKVNMTYRWMDELGMEKPKNGYEYVAGTCFAVRAKVQDKIKRLNMGIDDFPESARGVFSLAHGMERIICLDVQMQGYEFYGTKTCRLRRKFRNMGSDDYRNTSALRLLEDDRFAFDDDFFYRGLENRRVASWEIVQMPLNKIRRRWFDGNFYSLTECSPYKYLQGDTKAYDEYCEYHHINNLPDMTRARFDALIDSIKTNGYNPDNIIVISKNNILLDGQHRSCCLMHLYGEDYRANVLRITFAPNPEVVKAKYRREKVYPKIYAALRMFFTFGASFAAMISYTTWKSVGWALVHGLCNWFYVIYHAIRF